MKGELEMAKQSTTQKKLLLITVPLVILALVIGVVYAINDEKPVQSDSKHEKAQLSATEKLVEETFTLSKKGKVPNIPFVAGKTKWMEVTEAWGTTEQIAETEKARYEEYQNQLTTIGYAGNVVNDIRSYDANLQTISLADIKNVAGEPDDVRYYQDETHDQIILAYDINTSTELLWVLPKATEQEPDPKVDHISLYTQVDDKAVIQSLVEVMSVEEKIGQMILAGISGTTMNTATKNLISQHRVGGIIFYQDNFQSPEQTVQLVNQIKEENQTNLPLFLSTDQEGGRVTRLPGGLVNFPSNKQIGNVNNPEFSYKIGTLLGKELKAFGLNFNFAPVLDVNSNPKNPVIGDRSFGNNAEIVSNLGIQTLKGLQSQNVIPTIKHFPGHGDTSVDSHLELPIVDKSLEELEALELIPFKQAINEGADVVMVAHILLPQLDQNHPATMSQAVMTDMLRKQLGFSGVIITDDMTMGAIINHYNIANAAVESVKAGSDVILVGHGYSNVEKVISSLKAAIESGDISQERLNESVERIMLLKKKYDIDHAKVENVNVNALNQEITTLLNTYYQ